MPQPADAGPAQPHCLARALYDNVADAPDELAFRRGDTLVVLEQNAEGIEGWWLCALRGRQGICPANRLRLIPGVYEDSNQSRVCSPQIPDVPGDFSYLQRQGKRRSWHVHPNQVVTPKRFNDVYLYDMPPSRCSPAPGGGAAVGASPADCYDVPPRAVPVGGCPRCSPAAPQPQPPPAASVAETYDVPRALHLQPAAGPLTPSSSASSLTADSLSSSNRSSLANMPDYDVPRPHPRGVQQIPTLLPATVAPGHPQQHHAHHHHHHQQPPAAPAQTTYDVPAPHLAKELPLELGSALENLERLQTDSTSAISKLLSFVAPQWRSRERLENTLMEIKLAATRLRTSLHDLADFGEGALGNAGRASDRNLAGKLAPLVAAIRKSDALVQEAARELNRHGWSLDVLARPEHEDSPTSISSSIHKPDELDQLVACARALTEDIRQIASFIQGNGTLLFKREARQAAPAEWAEEYDYVSLDSKENVSRSRALILDDLPGELRKGFGNCVRHADDVAFDADQRLASDDRQLLQFFATQTVAHHANLTQAIDAFLQTVEHNQPPKIFLAHGKFVVLSAHKLVHIGDTVHRNVTCKDVKERALNCANALSDALAASVTKTKQAALQFPSVTAVQEMVDSIVDISHSARDLKVCLVQAAAPV